MLYLDGRHAQAGLSAALAARAQNVPVLVEADAVPYTSATELEPLLGLADYVVTTPEWPGLLTGLDDVEGGLAFVLQRMAPRAKMAVATIADCKEGCIALVRPLEDLVGGNRGADGGWTQQHSAAAAARRTPPSSPSRGAAAGMSALELASSDKQLVCVL